ncbi:MAG: hypothetical protein WDZ60_09440, partial [Wenzhouxiangellaceae bacterium]
MSRARLISILFIAGLFGLLLSWWNWDQFAAAMVLDPALDDPPRQFEVDEPAFTLYANDFDYRVQPLYNYELTGLVVSFKRFRPGIGIHERWNDYINIADICVIWGENARDVDLNAFEFWNLEFTCNYSTRSQGDWERFNRDQLSNNHIVTTDERLKRMRMLGTARFGQGNLEEGRKQIAAAEALLNERRAARYPEADQ